MFVGCAYPLAFITLAPFGKGEGRRAEITTQELSALLSGIDLCSTSPPLSARSNFTGIIAAFACTNANETGFSSCRRRAGAQLHNFGGRHAPAVDLISLLTLDRTSSYSWSSGGASSKRHVQLILLPTELANRLPARFLVRDYTLPMLAPLTALFLHAPLCAQPKARRQWCSCDRTSALADRLMPPARVAPV
jgi:hypothetical protein